MNAEIRPEADLTLRKQIERVVRPVCAGRDRKLVMREELFAHLTALYVDELKQQPNEQAAMSAALQRFGEPAALTTELNGSVGWLERYYYYSGLIDHCFSPYTGESLFRFSLRLFFALGLAHLTIFIAAALVDNSVVHWSGDPTGLRLLPNLIVLLIAGEVAMVVAAWDISRNLNRNLYPLRWFWAGGLAILWSLVVIAIVALFWWSVTGTFTGFHRIAGRAAVWGVGGLATVFGPLPVLLLASGWILQASQKYRQKYEAWTTLAIDE
jgi:hypothetical protein